MGVDLYVKSFIDVWTFRIRNRDIIIHRSSSDTRYLGRIDTRRHCRYCNMHVIQPASDSDIHRCNDTVRIIHVLDV